MNFQNYAAPVLINEEEYTLLAENLDELGVLDKQKIASFIAVSRKHQIQRLLNKAIDEQLSATQRSIIKKLWFEGLSISEISRQLGVSKSTVSRQIKFAYDSLRVALQYVIEYQFESVPDTIDYLKEAIKYEKRH